MKTKEDTQKESIYNSLFSFSFTSIGNKIKGAGATSLSESLKSNTTLTLLNLRSEDKRKKTHKRHPSTIHSFPFLITSTENKIRDAGASSLSEALKSNTTLTELNLNGEDKRKKTHKRHPSTIHSFPLLLTSTDNKIGEIGTASLSELLESNTTLKKLDLCSEYRRKTHKRHPSTHHSVFLFSSTDNEIGERGATSLSESLKSNTTLTELILGSEDKRKKTHKKTSINK